MNQRYKWYVVGMLWWIAFFNYADRQAIFSVFPLLEKELHLTPVQLGLLGSSFAWVYGICAPLAGNIVDRVRRKTAILTGLHTWSLVCLATALSRNFRHLLFFRAAEGLGETSYFPASMSMIGDYHGKKTRSRAMGIHQSSVYLGTIAGGFFAGLIGQHYGWRSSFVIFGGCGILLGLVLQRFLREPNRGAADLKDAGAGEQAATVRRMSIPDFLKVIRRTPTVLCLMLAFMCENFTTMVLFTWMPSFLYNKFHLSLAMAGLTATIYIQLASMVGSPVGGWFADILRSRTPGGRIIVQGIGILLEAPFVVWCALTDSLSLLPVALVFWGLFRGLYEANIFASVFDVVRPEMRGTATGFMNIMGWLAGGGTAPVVIGYLAERKGLSIAIAATSCSYVLAGLLLFAAVLFFVRRDATQMEAEIAARTRVASQQAVPANP
jgi:MFS family permease